MVSRIPVPYNLSGTAQGLANWLVARGVGVVSVNERTPAKEGIIVLELLGHHVELGDGYAVLVRESAEKTGHLHGKCRYTANGLLFDIQQSAQYYGRKLKIS